MNDKVKTGIDIRKVIDRVFSLPFLKVVLLGVVGVVILCMVLSLDTKEDSVVLDSDANEVVVSKDRYLTTIQYASYLEEKLIGLLSNVSGIGKVTAMVSLDGSTDYDYATSSNSGDSANIIYVEDGAYKYPLVISEVLPKVTSVTLVCQGLSSKSKVDITRAVSSLLNISTDDIYVLEG